VMFALQDAMAREPTSLGQNLRLAFQGQAHQELQQLLAYAELSESELVGLQGRLEQIEFASGARLGLLGERAMGYHAFLHDMKVEGTNADAPFVAGTRREFPRRAIDCAYYLSQMREQIDCTATSFTDGWFCDMRIHNRLVDLRENGYWWQWEEVRVSRQLLGNLMHRFLAGGQARRDSAIAAIATRRYQLHHGEPPDSLAALVPEFLDSIPTDPFLDRGPPLEFVRQGNHIAIYSVGDDQESDMALFQSADTEEDIGFVLTVELPKVSAPP
jgi:hypothetical protein